MRKKIAATGLANIIKNVMSVLKRYPEFLPEGLYMATTTREEIYSKDLKCAYPLKNKYLKIKENVHILHPQNSPSRIVCKEIIKQLCNVHAMFLADNRGEN